MFVCLFVCLGLFVCLFVCLFVSSRLELEYIESALKVLESTLFSGSPSCTTSKDINDRISIYKTYSGVRLSPAVLFVK